MGTFVPLVEINYMDRRGKGRSAWSTESLLSRDFLFAEKTGEDLAFKELKPVQGSKCHRAARTLGWNLQWS